MLLLKIFSVPDIFLGIDKMTEKAAPDESHGEAPPPIPPMQELATPSGTHNVQPPNEIQNPTEPEQDQGAKGKLKKANSLVITLITANICLIEKDFEYMNM